MMMPQRLQGGIHSKSQKVAYFWSEGWAVIGIQPRGQGGSCCKVLSLDLVLIIRMSIDVFH